MFTRYLMLAICAFVITACSGGGSSEESKNNPESDGGPGSDVVTHNLDESNWDQFNWQ